MEDRGRLARSRSRMMHGGWMAARALDDSSRARFHLLVDTLIPVEDGWPDAANLRVAETAELYLVPDGEELSFYPHVRYSDFVVLLEEVAAPWEGADVMQRVQSLQALEADDAATFALLRDFVYYVFYGSPTVVEELRARSRYGTDFHGATQPAGYDARLEGWGDRPLTTRGTFIPTEAVVRTVVRARGGSLVH